MALLEHLVQIFFVSAVLVGVVLKLQPQLFQGVAVPGRSANIIPTSDSSHTCSCPEQTSDSLTLDKLFTDNVS